MAQDITRKAPAFLNLARNYGVNVANVVEAIRQPLYDKVAYAAAGTTQMVFFSAPIGQNNKTIVDTNMTIAGSLPAPQNFLVTSIHLMFTPGVLPSAGTYLDDVDAFSKDGILQLQVGSKIQLSDGPLIKFPPHTLIEANTTTANGYAQVKGMVYDITPILIPWGQNFDVTLRWNTAVALPSTVAGSVRCTLDGYLYRLAQ